MKQEARIERVRVRGVLLFCLNNFYRRFYPTLTPALSLWERECQHSVQLPWYHNGDRAPNNGGLSPSKITAGCFLQVRIKLSGSPLLTKFRHIFGFELIHISNDINARGINFLWFTKEFIFII